MEAKASGGIAVDVKGCARCGTDHNGHLFMRLTNPQDEYDWWAFCPLLREPILVKISIPEAPKSPTPEQLQRMREEEERGREVTRAAAEKAVTTVAESARDSVRGGRSRPVENQNASYTPNVDG